MLASAEACADRPGIKSLAAPKGGVCAPSTRTTFREF